ncbi:T3SS (YopN, CesT) and YbjN peptide-binding chaperone 1 [Dactylosporangium sp. NPDC051541]|uniref:T3SS (YopN, CesT) and YbjN peptide-binding chaperone 1 n=1 Tax=Dactylosporangium sp. NPDC051541 TaxID=3363977 RepID=UPI00379C4B69
MAGEPGDGGGVFESALFDDEDPVGGNLKEKVAEAWRDFARQLVDGLRDLAPGTTLDLTLDPTASGTGDAVYSVQVTGEEDDQLAATAVSNADLPPAYRLDRAVIAGIVALGWSPPGVVAGSGESFGLRVGKTEAPQLARLITRTLRDIYGAPHPAFVTYLAHDAEGRVAPVPTLGVARSLASILDADGDGIVDVVRAGAGSLAELNQQTDDLPLYDKVTTVVAKLMKTTPEELPIDPDGDIGIRSGSAMVFVRVRDNPPLVDVFSPILTEIEPTERLYVKLSELTNRMPIGRLYCTNDTVWASVPVFGRDFQATHLMLAVQVMTGLADELDDRLHGEFGGKRFFGEGDKPKPAITGEGERTGMYL